MTVATEVQKKENGARVCEIRKRICSCEMQSLDAPWRERDESRVRSVDSDEGETSHFAVHRQ